MITLRRPASTSYGWVVVIGVTAILTFASGARFLYGVALKPVAEEFGWNRADLTVAVLINMIALSALQPLMGVAIDRVGSKPVLVGGVLALGVALVPISFADQLWHFYVLYGLAAAIGLAATSPVNVTALVSAWFRRRRGTALAIATSGAAFGQLIIVPVAAWALTTTDWQTMYRAMAAALLVAMLPVAVLLVREAPGARQARQSSNHQTSQPASSLARTPTAAPQESVDLRTAVNTSPFWLLAFGFFVCGFTMAFASTHFLAYADDMGMQPVEAADVIAVTAVFSIIGSILLGIAADRYRRSYVLGLTYALRGAAFVMLVILPAGPLLFLYALVLGISWTATTPLTAAIAADLYGRARLGVIFGTMFTFMNVGFGAGAFLDGLTYDTTGSYGVALLANAILGTAAAVAVLRVPARGVLPPADGAQPDRSLETTDAAVVPAD